MTTFTQAAASSPEVLSSIYLEAGTYSAFRALATVQAYAGETGSLFLRAVGSGVDITTITGIGGSRVSVSSSGFTISSAGWHDVLGGLSSIAAQAVLEIESLSASFVSPPTAPTPVLIDEYWENFGTTDLAGAIGAGDSSISVVDGSVFPATGPVRLVIENGETREVVTMTSRSSNTLTVQRGQQGTAQTAFPLGGTISVRLTELTLENFRDNINALSSQYVALRSVYDQSYSGFVDRSDTVLTWTRATRTIQVAPAVDTFDVAVLGVTEAISEAKSLQIPNIQGLHYIYFDSDWALHSTQTFADAIITQYAFVALIYWDAANAREVLAADERHGVLMPTVLHSYLHRTQGSKLCRCYPTQFDLTINTGGSGNAATDAQIGLTGGALIDEDLTLADTETDQALTLPAEIPILYRVGATEHRIKDGDAYPLIYAGSVAGYAGTRCAYNLLSGGVWSVAEVPNNDYAFIHILAWNSIHTRIVGHLGTHTYATAALARSAVQKELLEISLAGLPGLEFVPLYSLIFQTGNAYGNTPKARWQPVSTSPAADVADWRALVPQVV